MKKRGDLANNVLSLIIAVLVISVLIFGAVKLYGVFLNQESENAKKVLKNIMGKVNLLEDGQKGNFLIQGFENAESWYLLGWSENDNSRPDKCFGSCVCVCKGETSGDCDGQFGFCEKVGKESVFVDTYITFDEPQVFVRGMTGPQGAVSDCYKIKLVRNLKDLQIEVREKDLQIRENLVIETERKDATPANFINSLLQQGWNIAIIPNYGRIPARDHFCFYTNQQQIGRI